MRSIHVLLVATLVACSGPSKPGPAPPAADRVLVNVDADGLAVSGHDPIAYVADKRPVAGDAAHASTHLGATYHFASADHKATFDADPATHAPRYGGYCAYAASQNRLSPVEPDQFEIVDGQVLLFTNKEFRDLFNQDPAGHKAKADQNWPGLVARYGKPIR